MEIPIDENCEDITVLPTTLINLGEDQCLSSYYTITRKCIFFAIDYQENKIEKDSYEIVRIWTEHDRCPVGQ